MMEKLRIPRSSRAACLAGVLLLAALAAPSALADKSVLRIVFDGPVAEAPTEEFDLGMLFGGQKPRTLREITTTIDKATKDASVAGIMMIVESPSMSVAQLEEITRTLGAFRKAGKKVHCYFDSASNLSYALSCAADDITLAENGELAILGLNAQLSFYKGLLDKIGVQADMLHCGAYKSALEPYTRTEPSKEAADNVNWLLDGIFDRWIRLLADGRKLSPTQIQAAVDSAPIDAKRALELKLVDEVSSFSAFQQRIRKEYGRDVKIIKRMDKKDDLEIDLENPFAFFSMFSKLMKEGSEESKPGIGLIYIDGPIATGTNQADPLMGGTTAGSTTLRAAFDRAAKDENVKAVVVRVNSPGGSALASDIIWEAATRCGKEKPLVVSMGGVAGSGGYYVAIPADTIFAEEATITASIGVVGGKMVTRGLFEEKLGITTTEFPRGKRASLYSTERPWNEDERTAMAAYMDGIYGQFKGRIKQSRGDRIKGKLEDMAEGRVYTGKQALERGLIDKLGGLDDAIRFAAAKVGMADYEIHILPKKKNFFDVLKKIMGEDTDDDYDFVASLPTPQTDTLLGAAVPLLQHIAPDASRRILADLRNLALLQREGVLCVMPLNLSVK